MSWNVQGKGIKEIQTAWSELGLSGMDFFGIQELGGQKELIPPWQTIEASLDGAWNFYVCNPPQAFRAVAVGLQLRYMRVFKA